MELAPNRGMNMKNSEKLKNFFNKPKISKENKNTETKKTNWEKILCMIAAIILMLLAGISNIYSLYPQLVASLVLFLFSIIGIIHFSE